MKKIWIGLFSILMGISILLFTPDSVSADVDMPVDRVHIEVDVPVDGVSLKSTAIVHEFIDSKNMEMKNTNTASEVMGVYWYKTTEPSKVLSEGYKAKLGESYHVMVVLKAKDGYAFVSDMHNKMNLVNGTQADTFSGTMANGDPIWTFESEFSTVPAASGNPVVVIKDMELAPYEGNPMEIILEVTNATNVKYQWQITYGDDNGWGGTVDLDDNYAYQGTKTNHFKIHSYFGDTFDEDLNFGKVQCKVTSDNGTAYSQQVWYTLRDRQAVNGFSLTGLDTPVFGKKPDYAVNSEDSSKYYVKKVVWYGPMTTDGTYPEIERNAVFEEGKYTCKIIVATTDAYKIDDTYYGKVNNTNYIINTIEGKNQPIYGPDTYYVNIPFTVSAVSLDQIGATVAVPVTGKLPEKAVSNINGATAAETEWAKMDDRGRYISLKEGEVFEADAVYRCSVKMQLEAGYKFETILKAYINGAEASLSTLKGTDYRWIEYRFKTEKEDPVVPDQPEDPEVPDQPDDPVVPDKPEDPEVPDQPDDPAVPDKPVKPANPFTDVKEADYFYDAVLWAVEKGITTGTSKTEFSPDGSCTRAQAVTFIWREAGQPEPTNKTMPFNDVEKGTYYEKAVLWAVEKGITAGTSETTFSPEDACTRAQIVTFLWRANGQPDVSAANPFKDVFSQDYYYNAVLWAVEKHITTGVSKTEFAPENDCTRAQIVTFLYRNSVGV